MTTLIQTDRPLLQKGSRGAAVQELQTLLIKQLGKVAIDTDGVTVDGDFGAKTEAAVQRYQQRFELVVDGIVGNKTWSSLLQTVFTDISGHWAANFIVQLANANLIRGFADGTFRPNALIKRAEYAALLVKAFDTAPQQAAKTFSDVPADFWASAVIQQAYRAGFLAGYPDGSFKPSQNILRQDVLVSLIRARRLSPIADLSKLNFYTDASSIAQYAKDEVATATELTLVVNQPTLKQLRPTQPATRAEVAAMVGRAWALQGPGPKYGVESPFVVVA